MRNKFSRIILVALSLVVLVVVSACGNSNEDNKASSEKNQNKIQVVASFYPMVEFTKNIGGDKVNVSVLIPDGVEPHSWEPSAKDLESIKDANLFVYNGVVEGWAPQAIAALGSDKVNSVEAGKGLFSASNDPHTWISPKNAIQEVENIKDALIKVDPTNKEVYEENTKNYIAKLQDLDKRFTKLGKEARHKEFVTTHAAFGYLARDYGLKQIPIMGISPLAEPTPKELKALVEVIKAHNITAVYAEPLISRNIADTIAKATKTEVLTLNPAAGLTPEEKKQNLDYVSIMNDNLRNLSLSLLKK
jgi:zinc transport system substrate-binding protein